MLTVRLLRMFLQQERFFISRESDNVIGEYTADGKATGRSLNIPDDYKKCVGNYGFESLAYDEEAHLFGP